MQKLKRPIENFLPMILANVDHMLSYKKSNKIQKLIHKIFSGNGGINLEVNDESKKVDNLQNT